MNKFPVITEDKQKLYEKIFCDNEKLQNEIPSICGYYGRGCRRMNRPSNGMPCIIAYGFNTRELMEKWKDYDITLKRDDMLFLDMITKREM